MKSLEKTGASPAVHGLKRSGEASGVILEYHRISEVIPDPHSLCVSPEHFSEHLEVLSGRYTPTSLERMCEGLREGGIAPESVAITFDDGYADNLYSAKPILESYGIPATFFAALGFVERGQEFWWDELERCLLESSSLPTTLELKTNGKLYRRSLRGSHGALEHRDQSYWGWNLGVKVTPTPRHTAYRELHAILRSLPPSQRGKILGELRSLSGFEGEPAREEFRPLKPEELRELDKGDSVDIGAHGLTHSVLGTLPPEDQVEEIEGCKERLEGILGRRISLFAYPFGGKRDYTSETKSIVRCAGFVGACASHPDRVLPSTDPFQLPRFYVYDWNGKHFEREMERFFRAKTRLRSLFSR